MDDNSSVNSTSLSSGVANRADSDTVDVGREDRPALQNEAPVPNSSSQPVATTDSDVEMAAPQSSQPAVTLSSAGELNSLQRNNDDNDSIPDLEPISDSSEDEFEVEMHTVDDDDGDSDWLDESPPHYFPNSNSSNRFPQTHYGFQFSEIDPAMPGLEPIPPPTDTPSGLASSSSSYLNQSTSSLPSSGEGTPQRRNRRSRVDTDHDEERDRRHPFQRTGRGIGDGSSQSQQTPSTASHNTDDSSRPSDQQQQPLPGLPTFETIGLTFALGPDGRPVLRHHHHHVHTGPEPGMAQNTPNRDPAQPHVHPAPPNGNPLPPGGARLTDLFGLLNEAFGLTLAMGANGQFGELGNQEDPEKARQLLEGMDAVPEGLVRRLEGLDKYKTGGESGSDGICAVCWDALLSDGGFGVDNEKVESVDEGSSASSSADSNGDPLNSTSPSSSVQGSDSTEGSSSAQQTSSPSRKPLPKIVSLPCTHVFHSSCLIPWFSKPRRTTCPTCRFDVDPEGLIWGRQPGFLGTPFGDLFGGAGGVPIGRFPMPIPPQAPANTNPPPANNNAPPNPGAAGNNMFSFTVNGVPFNPPSLVPPASTGAQAEAAEPASRNVEPVPRTRPRSSSVPSGRVRAGPQHANIGHGLVDLSDVPTLGAPDLQRGRNGRSGIAVDVMFNVIPGPLPGNRGGIIPHRRPQSSQPPPPAQDPPATDAPSNPSSNPVSSQPADAAPSNPPNAPPTNAPRNALADGFAMSFGLDFLFGPPMPPPMGGQGDAAGDTGDNMDVDMDAPADNGGVWVPMAMFGGTLGPDGAFTPIGIPGFPGQAQMANQGSNPGQNAQPAGQAQHPNPGSDVGPADAAPGATSPPHQQQQQQQQQHPPSPPPFGIPIGSLSASIASMVMQAFGLTTQPPTGGQANGPNSTPGNVSAAGGPAGTQDMPPHQQSAPQQQSEQPPLQSAPQGGPLPQLHGQPLAQAAAAGLPPGIPAQLVAQMFGGVPIPSGPARVPVQAQPPVFGPPPPPAPGSQPQGHRRAPGPPTHQHPHLHNHAARAGSLLEHLRGRLQSGMPGGAPQPNQNNLFSQLFPPGNPNPEDLDRLRARLGLNPGPGVGAGTGVRMGGPAAPAAAAREQKKWAAPPAPGLTLRQRVEKKEREAGLRCDDVSCGVGPSDEDPVVSDAATALQQLAIRALKHEHNVLGSDAGAGSLLDGGDVGAGKEKEAQACRHTFHPACLVTTERVALQGAEEKVQDGDVEVSCPVCRVLGTVDKSDWDAGVRALQV